MHGTKCAVLGSGRALPAPRYFPHTYVAARGCVHILCDKVRVCSLLVNGDGREVLSRLASRSDPDCMGWVLGSPGWLLAFGYGGACFLADSTPNPYYLGVSALCKSGIFHLCRAR